MKRSFVHLGCSSLSPGYHFYNSFFYLIYYFKEKLGSETGVLASESVNIN